MPDGKGVENPSLSSGVFLRTGNTARDHHTFLREKQEGGRELTTVIG